MLCGRNIQIKCAGETVKLEILYEDEYLLACVKPCGVPSQADKSNDEDMITRVKHYLYDKDLSKAPEEPYVAAIHRLDRPVGGVMLFAKNQETAAKLSDAQQDGEITKYYQAIITGELPDMDGEMVDYLVRDAKTNMTKIAKKGDKGAKRAALTYEVLDVFDTDAGTLSYVLIELETGRHHQIRTQFANRNCGIWGDTKYNPLFAKTKRRYRQIGLYASRMELMHPITNEPLVFKSEPQGEAFDVIEMDEFE